LLNSRCVLTDNDRAFGRVFTRCIQAMGIRDRPTSFRSPWQNGHIERLIGSIRRECTDHLIVFNEEHLRRILAKFSTYYSGWRPYFAWEGCTKQTPDRALWRHCRTCNLGRIASPVRENLVFGSDRSGEFPPLTTTSFFLQHEASLFSECTLWVISGQIVPGQNPALSALVQKRTRYQARWRAKAKLVLLCNRGVRPDEHWRATRCSMVSH
jgi:hypothetical protein